LWQLCKTAIVTRLWKLAAARNTTGKVEMDTIKLILLAMARFHQSVPMTVAGFAALEASGVLGVQDAAQALIEANGAALVVNQMKANATEPACQEYGTWILGSLSFLGHGERVEFHGGVEACLEALQNNPANLKVVRNALRALDGLSQTASDVSMSDGRLEALEGVLRERKPDPHAIKLACAAIATILRAAGDQAAELVNDAEIVEEAVSALSVHLDDKEVMHNGMMMLGTLLWAKKGEMGNLNHLTPKVNALAAEAFEKHHSCVKVKQSVSWLQSLTRGNQGLEIN